MPAASPSLRTPAQNSAIYAALADLSRKSGLSRDDLRPTLDAICERLSGQAHTSRLTVDQARRLLVELAAENAKYDLGANPRSAGPSKPAAAAHEAWGPRGPGDRVEQKITRFQQVVIAGLFRTLGMDAAAQRAFATKQCKRPWPQTMHDADALVEPLTAMALRRTSVADLRNRVATCRSVALDAWKDNFLADLARQLGEIPEGHGLTKHNFSGHKLGKLLECEAAYQAKVGGAP